MSISPSQIYILNLLELCVTIFRGPNSTGWTQLAHAGVPELLRHVQQNPESLKLPIQELGNTLISPKKADTAELETEYVRLFITSPNGVPAPLYASCHLDTTPRTMGQSAVDMQARLHQAGLEIAMASNEPADHLTIELEYLYTLLAQGWSASPQDIRDSKDFARATMLPWVRTFRTALLSAHPHPVFEHAGNLLVAVLEIVADGHCRASS
ncbi:hypothetical protein GO013_13715 [Pseudodesulfovibrio sp. JC047]|uniref:TorD/DmsD family molecular chaperone n=1 Tax=Pseudodesulfovibrio sp. JC047 TaxID=2683199 RepID=UPI0013D7F439|nr:molecular chaperone TorD family protein [Pseudodesulfovibrio sp. JC047]NDV20468.1 hypothetical protein [Pseudodesulfovibrio sp. JC047]